MSTLPLGCYTEVLVPEPVDRLHAIFTGEVQGVGFRYTARRAASAYQEVTGMVRNLSDGTVELIAEGGRKDIMSLLSDIKSSMDRYITDINERWSSSEREYRSFLIGF
jgi:acylphosphatase